MTHVSGINPTIIVTVPHNDIRATTLLSQLLYAFFTDAVIGPQVFQTWHWNYLILINKMKLLTHSNIEFYWKKLVHKISVGKNMKALQTSYLHKTSRSKQKQNPKPFWGYFDFWFNQWVFLIVIIWKNIHN